MTTGALIFARNNEHTDYVAMARWSAKNIERHLGIETHIVTDDSRTDSVARHFTDVGKVTWHNTNRMDAYRLTPWDRTLVLDADYVVASDQLRGVLDSDEDFLAHRWAYDVTGCNDFQGLNYFGDVGMPMWWATVMVFNKTKSTQLLFEHMRMIKANWNHYVDLFGIGRSVYRNDHALSIALTTANGHWLDAHDIPWDLASLTVDAKIQQQEVDTYRIEFCDSSRKSKWITVEGMDFHAMGKQQLGEIVANHA